MRPAGKVTSLSAVVATGAGAELNADGRHSASVQIAATSVSSGAQFVLEGTLDDVKWSYLTPKDGDQANLAIGNRIGVISSTGDYILEYENICALKVRANCVAWTDGTYTAKIRVQD